MSICHKTKNPDQITPNLSGHIYYPFIRALLAKMIFMADIKQDDRILECYETILIFRVKSHGQLFLSRKNI